MDLIETVLSIARFGSIVAIPLAGVALANAMRVGQSFACELLMWVNA